MAFRGDAHKFYLKLRRVNHSSNSHKRLRELEEIQDIRTFYRTLDTYTLKLVYFRIIKERNGSGMIPIFITAVPWFLFLFSDKLEDILFQHGNSLWILFSLLYFFTLTSSVIIHFRERAWAVMHIEIIQDIIAERNEPGYASPTDKSHN
ncbi:hypothetical protein [Radiobacillus deserti]|uniref:Uncharacterized protein n=1 Tax=Radiobacillus deserti TaxID=2594883 RepID=A0A516KI72_9BACI|nr:hypothetical protein [Radiobacillus deserti]QDP41095.1 hypothetical protein FN924_13380 [Radiobacillus deserti]